MDESLWELFWTTGLPEVYALAKQGGSQAPPMPGAGTGGAGLSPGSQDIRQEPL